MILQTKDIENIKKLNEEYKMFSVLTFHNPENKNIENTKNTKLSKYTISLKDAIWLKDVESTASSKILRGFKPVKNSAVADKIISNGGEIIGKTVQDEFGFGTFSTNIGIGYDAPLNPSDKERCAGGSSGGCAVAVKLIDNHISVAESTGGSITTPASFCGVVGLCPTYGRISRDGLITYSSSLDKIGVMSKTVKESAEMLEIISGKDVNDETSADKPIEKYSEFSDNPIEKIKGFKVGVLNPSGVDSNISKRVKEIITKLSNNGVKTEEIDLPYMTKYALSAYYIIAMSEASTHLACLAGLRYGASKEIKKDEMYNEFFSAVRTDNFGNEAKRRILLGTFARMSGYRGQYYMKALKVRKKIIDEYKEIFKKFDAIVTPTSPITAPKFSEIDNMSIKDIYNLDYLSVGPNISGLPHISIPIQNEQELPYGILFIADHFNESKLISLSSAVEVIR